MPDRLKIFKEVLDAAIADIIEHGYSSQERVDKWTRELRLAAERSMVSPESLEQQLRDGLAAVYRQQVEQGGIIKRHPGIERFTLDRVRPQLRSELDRRIMASANLIKLNRAQAIEETLRRFQGWSTSIPPGGVSRETRAEVKANVKKSMASLPFVERRVIVDQSHKLVSSISQIIATGGGAIAGRWRSNWRQANYNYREDHKERDEHVYLVRDSWAHAAKLVKKNSDGYYDEHEAAGELPFCRCYVTWLYALRDLPDDMLTAKGRAALASVQGHEEVRSARQARADSADETTRDGLGPRAGAAFASAVRQDLMRYSDGLKRIAATPGTSEWHAEYDDERDQIALHPAFHELSDDEMVHTLLHEFGHRGQEVDSEVFRQFKARHVADLESFREMANPTHLADFARTGKVDGGLADEVFAESYARMTLGLPMPEQLREFWRNRLELLSNRSYQQEVSYTATWPNRVTRCQRCTMFIRVCAGSHGNGCSAVRGEISAHGHCKLFEIKSPEPEKPPTRQEALRRLEKLERALNL
jgi:hypothetical protein